MGIAIASGVPPEKGLVTGIIGGIVVGMLAGRPCRSAARRRALPIVFEFVRDYGMSALGPVLVIAGLVQFLAGVVRMGGLFRAISPAVVHGMLAGIGALIVVGQFHILFDAKPLSNGMENLAAIPGRVLGLEPWSLRATEFALMIGLLTIGVMIAWEKLRPASLNLVPAALLGVVTATLVAYFFQLDVARIQVPDRSRRRSPCPIPASSACWPTPPDCHRGGHRLHRQRGNAAVGGGGRPDARWRAHRLQQGTARAGRGQLPVRRVRCAADDRCDRPQFRQRAGRREDPHVHRLARHLDLGFVALLPWLLRECRWRRWARCWW
jgi:hypothetical protein